MVLITQTASTRAVALKLWVADPAARAGALAKSSTANTAAVRSFTEFRGIFDSLFADLEIHCGGDGIRVGADRDVLTRDSGAVHVEGSRRLAGRRGGHVWGGRRPGGGRAGPVDVVAEVVRGGAELHRARSCRGSTGVEAVVKADARSRSLGAGDGDGAPGRGRIGAGV